MAHMTKIIRVCRALIITSLVLSLTTALLQFLIPYIISINIKEISKPDQVFLTIALLIAVFSLKSVTQCFSETLNQYIKSKIRLLIIEYIYDNILSTDQGKLATLIKEDSERIASSAIQIVELAGASSLTIITFSMLILENLFMAPPLLALFAFSYIHVTHSSKKITHAYTTEIEQEQRYKTSIIELKQASSESLRHFNHKMIMSNHHLKNAIGTKYRYEKISIYLSSGPEIFIAVIIAISLFLISTLSPKTLGADLIYYLGYIGMFALGANHSIQIALSLIGTKNSLHRVFNYTHEQSIR